MSSVAQIAKLVTNCLIITKTFFRTLHMELDQFDYHLPEELIAQVPLQQRTASRLLHFEADADCFEDLHFKDLLKLVRAGDLLVFNDTRVIPARLFGQKSSGGKVEFLLERMLSSHKVLSQLKASKSPKKGTQLIFADDVTAIVENRQEDFFILRFNQNTNVEEFLTRSGQMPLPPYIHREPDEDDKHRYQTVYAKHSGAVAAPTAGLHFDEEFLNSLRKKEVEFANITLHVGAGTFQPVREDNILQHKIHAEKVMVPKQVCEQITACKKRNSRVIAVGTTSVRALESAAQDGDFKPFEGDTSLYIYPGYEFKIVDALITNFHLPKSTLLMLVSAFAGYRTTMAAYRHAVAKRYRFYSYGDAMFIEKSN